MQILYWIKTDGWKLTASRNLLEIAPSHYASQPEAEPETNPNCNLNLVVHCKNVV